MTGPAPAEPVGTRIRYLAEVPGAIDLLATAFAEEWPADVTLEGMRKLFRDCCRSDAVPLALVACDGPDLLGTVALRWESIPERPDLGPWLAAFWVRADRRRQGIGARLIRAAEAEAARLGLHVLYAATATAGSLFERMGWQEMDRVIHRGEELAIYWREVAEAGRRGDGAAAPPV